MATKKKGGKKRTTTRNSASVKEGRPAANKTATRNTAKPQTHKKGGKRNSARRGWLPNGISRFVSGIDLQTALGVGGGMLTGKASDLILPTAEWTGIIAQGVEGLAVAYFFGKSKVGAGVAVGLVGLALYNAVNKASNNAIDNFVLGNVARFRPLPAPAQLPANVNGAGLGRYPARVVQFR